MKISNFTFIITDACNFRCSYCFQEKENKTISPATIGTSVDFFYPLFKSDGPVHVGFYGGEPLLAFDRVKQAVEAIEERNRTGHKDIHFALTTNGTLLNDEMLEFFSCHRFSLMLSFDGLAQDTGRQKGTLEKVLQSMKKIQRYPDIDFDINSVFTPQTVGMFFESIRYMIETGSPEITFDLASTVQWGFSDMIVLKDELEQLSDYLVSCYHETGRIPVKNFQVAQPNPDGSVQPKGPVCGAGRGHMSVTPDAHVWGCFMFHDYFKMRKNDSQYNDFSFGTLTDFIANHQNDRNGFAGVEANYAQLRQDYFQVNDRGKDNTKNNFCFTCEEVDSCMVCPVNAAYTSGSLGKVSCHNCRLEKMQRKVKREFKEKIVACSV